MKGCEFMILILAFSRLAFSAKNVQFLQMHEHACEHFDHLKPLEPCLSWNFASDFGARSVITLCDLHDVRPFKALMERGSANNYFGC